MKFFLSAVLILTFASGFVRAQRCDSRIFFVVHDQKGKPISNKKLKYKASDNMYLFYDETLKGYDPKINFETALGCPNGSQNFSITYRGKLMKILFKFTDEHDETIIFKFEEGNFVAELERAEGDIYSLKMKLKRARQIIKGQEN